MTEINYNVADLSMLKYVKIAYTDTEGKMHEVRTEVKFLGSDVIQLYFKHNRTIAINYPQDIIIKFVAEAGLYVAKAFLEKVEKVENMIFLTILPPETMDKQQNRKYYRINLNRCSILISKDKIGQNDVYMSRLIDLSAGGVFLHRLESMYDNKFVNIDPENYDSFSIVLILDSEIVLKMQARYVRQEKDDRFYKYAFEFINSKQSDIDTLSKYITQVQVEHLKNDITRIR